VEAGVEVAAVGIVRDEIRRVVLDDGLPPHLVEPSVAIGDAAFRATWHPCDPWHDGRRRAAATAQACKAFGVRVAQEPLVAFLADADRFVLVGAAVAGGQVRPKLYLFAPNADDALGVALRALGLPAPDPRAHLAGVDFLGDRPDVKSYVRLGADKLAKLNEVNLGPWLRDRGVPLEALEVHECSRRDASGQVRDRSLHVHFAPAQDASLAVAWASARGGPRDVARVGALRASARLALRVLSTTVGGGAEHAYLSVGPGGDPGRST
jgi:hypothetical protein